MTGTSFFFTHTKYTLIEPSICVIIIFMNAKSLSRQSHLFDRKYADEKMYYGGAVRPEFERLIARLPEKPHHVLDIGCGDGRYALYTARHLGTVHAVDLSAVGVNKLAAAAKTEDLPIDTVCADISQYAFPRATYDLVIFATILDHLPAAARRHVIAGVQHCLKPGGYFYGNVFTRADPGFLRRQSAPAPAGVSETAAAIVHYFAPDELRDCFAGQNILEYREFEEMDYSHGPPHLHGWACIIGRKPSR